jgi:Asp-tRNA(Asn)/Glu-tRNA(Gln) amidotransferase A subunit family amidase
VTWADPQTVTRAVTSCGTRGKAAWPNGAAALRSSGLATGVQLLGRFDEDTLLEAATVIEARTGVFTPIDPR